jgi:hypothetical protein
MDTALPDLIVVAGFAQLSVLAASALVPFRLKWRDQLRVLPRLHRQMYWVYGGYVVLSIVAFAALSIWNSRELANGSGLARGFCAYVAIFWGVRVGLQAVFDVKEHMTTWWIRTGYVVLTMMFAGFTILYAWAALQSTVTGRG